MLHDHTTTDASAATGSSHNAQLSALYHSGNAARWRRKQQEDHFSHHQQRPTALSAGVRQRSMEEVHGVDVSWLHKPGKQQQQHQQQQDGIPELHRKHAAPPSQKAAVAERKPLPHASTSPMPPRRPSPQPSTDRTPNRLNQSPAVVTPPTPAHPAKDTTPAAPSTPTPAAIQNGAKPQAKRPAMLSRVSSKGKESEGRRSSWLNNISSKFSSQQATTDRSATVPLQQTLSNGQTPPVSGAPSPGLSPQTEEAEEPSPYIPSRPKDSSFFSSITRRLSSASTASVPRGQTGSGGVCARRVLNVDPNRQRCLVPEMDPGKLRKVSFCVDVEIAGRPQYTNEDDNGPENQQQKKQDAKMKERAEGEALKRPQAIEEEKDREGEVKLDARSAKALDMGKISRKISREDDDAEAGASPPDDGSLESAARKREKKQRSEAERKERKEKRRRRAEENGQLPVEMQLGDGSNESVPRPMSGASLSTANANNAMDTPPPVGSLPDIPVTGSAPPPRADRPTTDPVRIYRRCCQLRETPILKRITEQLMAPNCTLPAEPGVVNCLDLTSSRLQLADVVTLGDWLAVVPVRVLKLEDADLNDEGVRCVLAGLLAAKRPEPTKRKSKEPRHREPLRVPQVQERAGVVEKLNLKHNPRISRHGWKHISLFIYMCRSLKAIELSMNHFPDTLPASPHVTQTKSPQGAPRGDGSDTEAAEIFFKCLSERPGGSKLEELQMSECGLSTNQVRKVVDGAIMAGVSRLGLAGNHLDDEGLGHVLRYIRSGICQGLDLGGNDLHNKTSIFAEAINSKMHLPCWGLSFAGCNLDTQDLKALLPALAKLPDFRFVDFSHNRNLCTHDNGTISLFRRYMSQFKDLKRIHLSDVGMSPKQAIALADCLPDGPKLAHLNILENPMLSALAHARDEGMQEEACAVYASLMAAVRVSSTLICIDIDVPSPENSEVVKALAKQVVAYSLRNMEQFAIAEATGALTTANATAKLTEPHGGERVVKEITVPDVLMHLVGHVDGNSENHDGDDPAPDEDYIVGGTGVVKALQYVLGEKADDLRRTSVPGTPISGAMTPREGRPGSSAGFPPTEEQRGKAKKMSINLLGSARKIRARLQPALLKESSNGDELAFRRLNFLDSTLQNMIERFEQEYPETREVLPGSPHLSTSIASSQGSTDRKTDLSITTTATDFTLNASDEEDADDARAIKPPGLKRHGSEVSLAGRALSLEEGRLHRLGQELRREVVDSPTSTTTTTTTTTYPIRNHKDMEAERIRRLGEKLEALSGAELKTIVQTEGWETVLRKVGGNYDDLRLLQEQDPRGWEEFLEGQRNARLNLDRERPGSRGGR
ncbi:Microtubules assembly and stabilization protein [Recurvomyces mirabilis]|uniref:Microtubules assembly and stabilization protein n=2 Tax=Recurvomyces mirabilis TaxID=574656 RepID=A0AAE0WKH7_9PEZI|nr:Microtubules assembly and stabilization protein [Recurvomyces mirabilis]